ncbi:urease accessory protein UreF [Citrobacter koseri]|uniref:Urease accessory protein UreF n=1 Tax=Citrobacter koseri TaxID=545 RepID=A0A2X2YHY5_CITKO|nr:urease accessory protein UreF [Citrobacter koseri]
MPFGQQAAQQLILSLCDHYAQGMAQALARPDADLGSSTPLTAIASARHENTNIADYFAPEETR